MEKKTDKRLELQEKTEIRKFACFFSLGMAILFSVSVWKGFHLPVKVVIAFLGLSHLIFAFLNYKYVKPSFILVSFIVKKLCNFISLAITGIIFYLLFSPIAFILRLFKKDVVKSNCSRPGWVDIPEKYNNPARIEKSF